MRHTLTTALNRTRRLGALRLLLAAALSATALSTSAQRAQPGQPAAAPNFDVRTDKSDAANAARERFMGAAPAPPADLATAQLTGASQLRAAFASIEIVNSPELGTPEIVGTKPGGGFLTGPSADRVSAMRTFLATYRDAYGLSAEQVSSLELVADYQNPAGNLAWVEFEQRIGGVPVFQGLVRGAFTASGELVRTTGPLAAGLSSATLATAATLTAAEAVSRAADGVGWSVPAASLVQKGTADGGRVLFARGPMADDAKAWPVYFPLAQGVARLAWATEIWGDPDVYLVVLDAGDGTLLFRKNLTNYQTQYSTYVVYTDDSPAPLSPSTALPGSGTQAPFIARQSRTLIGNEAPNTFNNLGWMTDGTNETDGNNVQAGIDRDGTDGVDATVVGDGRGFDFTYNPQTDEPLAGAPNAYQKGEVTDTFYWTNVYHDRLYLLGFTEAARNFQQDNFSRGGVGGDRIRAEAQDSSGVNNANFSTPTDGSRGRMQMYIFPGPTPDRSSGLDHDVLIHELTHGTSNRLHNNGSGLSSTMSAGMGEGWSDFFGRALLSTASEDPNGLYTTGGWVTYQMDLGYTDNYYYGIRRFPYAVKTTVGANGRPHNPLTFADIDQAQINLTDGAFPRGPFGSSSAFAVHNIGEVWAMALMEVRARFIARLGFAVGNQRILQAVVDGMKLDPTTPTLLQGRDSIIAAINAGPGTTTEKNADIRDVWAGFATRGMGVSAQVVNASAGTVVEAFDTPGVTAATTTLVSEAIPNGRLDPGEVVTVSFCMTNTSTLTSGSVTATLAATGGVQSPSAPQAYGTIAPGGNVCRNYTFTVSASCGATVTATMQAEETGAPTRTVTYSLQVGNNPLSFFTEGFDGVTAPAFPVGWTTSTLSGTPNLWATSTTTPDSAPNRAFVTDLSTVSDSVLTSPSLVTPVGTRVTFRHLYNTEATWDGGVLEAAIGTGAFQDILAAGGTFVTGGYNGPLQVFSGNPLGGRMAWSGNSGTYVTTTVSMPAAAAGQSARLRWRLGSDSSLGAPGWSVDTITLSAFQCSGPTVAPTLTSMDVTSGMAGTSVNVALNGTGFLTGLTFGPMSGITVTNVIATSTTTATATFVIAPGTPPGSRNVTVTTSSGTSNTLIFNVLASLPTLSSINPTLGVKSTSVTVTLAGTNFATGMTIGAMPDVAVSNIFVASPTSATATFTIAAGAAIGPRSVVVTTAGGTSGALIFTVVDPFPDLSVSSAHVGNFGVGFNEIYTVAVSNVGTAVSSGTISVAGTLPAGLTFVAGTGAGWSCAATGQVVTCTNSTVLAVGASSSYALTVTAGPAAVGTVMHTVAVTGTGDLNPVNNSWTDPTIVRATPTPTFSFNPSAIIVGQQAGMSVTVGTPFPHDVTGSVTVTFGSNAAVPADDPAIQFATGGRTVTFTIPAESTQARFGSSTTTGPVGFQPGTVSGTLTFQGSLIAGTVKGAFSTTLAVPKQAPKILDVRTRTQDGFAAVIQLSSSPRDVTSLKLTFNTTVAVRLSCGSAAGCTTSGNTMTLDVAGLFSDWFQRDATFGSLSTITVPLTIPSGVGGTVAVTIRNSQGESNAGVFNLP